MTLAGQPAATSFSSAWQIEASRVLCITLFRSTSSRFTLLWEANRVICESASALPAKCFRFPCTLSSRPRRSSASLRRSEMRFATDRKNTLYFKFKGLENDAELHRRGNSAPVQQEHHAKEQGQSRS